MKKFKKSLIALLSVCMIITMMPFGVWAGETEENNETGGAPANQAEQTTELPEADENGKITLTGANTSYTLTSNVTADIVIEANANVTINLNDHNITDKTAADTIYVKNGAVLTITGNGTVDNVSNARAAVFNNGTVTLNGGTFDRSQENGQNKNSSGDNSWYTICNHGDMMVNAGVTVTTAGGGDNLETKGKFSSLVENGYYSYSSENERLGYVANTNNPNPTLTINAGTFNGGLNTIKNDDGAAVTINGGSFGNYYQAVVQNHHEATIAGGTFTVAEGADGITYGVYNCGCAAGLDKGTLTISGGTFTGASYGVYDVSSQPAQVKITGGTFNATDAAVAKHTAENYNKGEISVTGGTFSSDVSCLLYTSRCV